MQINLVTSFNELKHIVMNGVKENDNYEDNHWLCSEIMMNYILYYYILLYIYIVYSDHLILITWKFIHNVKCSLDRSIIGRHEQDRRNVTNLSNYNLLIIIVDC